MDKNYIKDISKTLENIKLDGIKLKGSQEEDNKINSLWNFFNSSRISDLFLILLLMSITTLVIRIFGLNTSFISDLEIYSVLSDFNWLLLLNDSLIYIFNYLMIFFIVTVLLGVLLRTLEYQLILNSMTSITYFRLSSTSFNLMGIIFMSNYIFRFNEGLLVTNVLINEVNSNWQVGLYFTFFIFYIIVLPLLMVIQQFNDRR